MNTNILLLIIELILCYIMIILLYKKLKIDGMYYYIVLVSILSNLMSLKTIELYEFNINLGLVSFTTIFVTSNIIVQKKGQDEIKKLILTLIPSIIIGYIILYLVSIMKYSEINAFTSASYNNIFLESPRIYFANIVTILYSVFLNSKLYFYLKKEKNHIWLSNIFSSIIIQFIASILFSFLAFAITTEIIEIIKIMIIRYAISLIICFVGTIIIYITNSIKER